MLRSNYEDKHFVPSKTWFLGVKSNLRTWTRYLNRNMFPRICKNQQTIWKSANFLSYVQTNEQTFKSDSSDSSTPLFMFWISSWNTEIIKTINHNIQEQTKKKLSQRRRQPSLHELLTDISFSPESKSDPKLNGDQACQNKTTWQSTIPTITKNEQKHASKHLNNYLVNDIQLMFLIRYINPRIPLYFQEHEAAYKQTNWSIN